MRLARLELATLWFEATYSIQLSDRRTNELDITEILGMESASHCQVEFYARVCLHEEHKPLISNL